MYLVVGNEADVLAREVCQRAGSATLCSENELLECCLNGSVNVAGERITRKCLRGAIVRPLRQRWHSSHSTLEGEDGEYHDRIAALYSFFTNLPCPVVNRFGLSWWVDDISYPWQLRIELESVLELVDGPPPEKTSCFGRLWPSARRVKSRSQSVYVSGELVRAATEEAQKFEDHVLKNATALQAWQKRSGVYLCRLDFNESEPIQLRHVEPFPMFEGECESLVGEIAAAALDVPA
jgi:hypothetical protein